jgi:inosose dehydratase
VRCRPAAGDPSSPAIEPLFPPMPPEHTLVTRRQALTAAAKAGLLLPALGAARSLGAEAPTPTPLLFGGAPLPKLRLGIATYSLRNLAIDDAIAALKAMQVTSVSVFRTHVPILLGTPDDCRAAAQRFKDAGLTLASTGVVTLKKSESVMRKAFECGKACGLSTLTASYETYPDRETLLLTERFVKEYNIRLAFHNHGPGDKAFPTPYDVWTAVQPYDARLGLCIDVGHTMRAGVDPVAAIFKCRSRLYDVHLKDSLASTGDKVDAPVELGYGRLEIRNIVAALIQIRFPFQVGLEDEVATKDPVPGVSQSFGYMRGVLAGLT